MFMGGPVGGGVGLFLASNGWVAMERTQHAKTMSCMYDKVD